MWFNLSVAEITTINGQSMYPFLNSKYNESLKTDYVLNYKLYAQRDLARGMIVTLRWASHSLCNGSSEAEMANPLPLSQEP